MLSFVGRFDLSSHAFSPASTLSSYVVYYQYPPIPPIWHPFISHLTYSYPLRPISLVGSQWSPVPTSPKSSLPHLSNPLFSILSSFSFSHPFATMPLSLSVLGGAEQIWTMLSRLWSLANDKRLRTSQKPIKGKKRKERKKEREDDIPLLRDMHAHSMPLVRVNKHHAHGERSKSACAHMHKARQTQTEARAYNRYLMFLCDSCLLKAHALAINLLTFAAHCFV